MFNAKIKASLNEVAGSSTTIIGAGTVITGNIESPADIRIDGTLIGDINVKAHLSCKPLVGAWLLANLSLA